MTNFLRHVDASPYASSLIEGLRDFSYSLETSLADIVDNSITAGSKNVDILANTTGEVPWIAVVDDGKGMSENALVDAMRPGSRNPKEDRLEDDLGRFGLGLKSASFAQARMLSVYSRSENEGICATWDLDEVAKSNAWQISLQDAFGPVAV